MKDVALPSVLTIAWAAGLFEGEGTVSVQINHRQLKGIEYRLCVHIGNTDKQVVDFFHQRWGGCLFVSRKQTERHNECWRWSVTGEWAAVFLRDIQDSLQTDRVKRKTELGLLFRAGQTRDQRLWTPAYKAVQKAIYEELLVLNRRGRSAL